ncbi:Uncharacterised protein [Bordetella pertussis]|nr:Uncharacterised protein [Bordetella pertussis]CFW30384.1 Uncharacterised protein [Bordetella pertussis]
MPCSISVCCESNRPSLGVASRMRLSIICRNSASNCRATSVCWRWPSGALTASRLRSARRPRSKTDSWTPGREV